MKRPGKILSLLLVMLMLLSVEMMPAALPAKVSAADSVVASISFENGVQGNGMSLNVNNDPNAEPYTYAGSIGGQSCRVIPSGHYMYIACDRSLVPSNKRNILIKITYYDNNSNSLWFNYNSTDADYKVADFKKSNSGDWATTTVVLTDANFRGTMSGGSDIRMGFNGSDNYIKEISLSFGSLDPDGEPIPAKPNNPNSEFFGKSFAGYQIWHRAGENPADWVHWSYGKVPGPGLQENVNVCSFPDVSDYPDEILYNTNFANLGDGRPTKLYSADNEVVISTQFNWMQEYGLDGVAVQRFVGGLGRTITATKRSYLDMVRDHAERTGRYFYIEYDLNGAESDILECLKNDWVYEIEQTRALTSSPNYATVNGKPVVEIWGIGMDFGIDRNKMMQILDFFHSRGCYVIAGTSRGWRTDDTSAIGDYTDVFREVDCISPWTVGAYNDINGANNYYNNYMKDDIAYCRQYGMDYLPICFAGSGNWVNDDLTLSETDRKGGELLWTQVRNAKALGVNSVFYAMFDEFEEDTNLIKAAVDYFDIPTDEYFETLSKNGIWVSSDYYLRLAGAASKLLRGEIANTADIPVAYSEGPLYFRNSFESRTTTFRRDAREVTKTMPIDPCFYEEGVLSSSGVNGATASIVQDSGHAKSGQYAVKLSGSSASGGSAQYVYKTNTTKITVTEGMSLSYWKYAANDLGRYTAVDLLFSDGTRLSNYASVTDQNGTAVGAGSAKGTVGSLQQTTVVIGEGELIGKTITGIAVAYDHPASGMFEAYFDDVIIEDEGGSTPDDTTEPTTQPDTEPTVPTQPGVQGMDLVVNSISMEPASPETGDEVTFRVEIQNIGDVTTPDIKHGLSIFVDGQQVNWCDTHLTSLAPGGTATLICNGGPAGKATWTATQGTHTAEAFIDDVYLIGESNENNNRLTRSFTVNDPVVEPSGPSDLVVKDIRSTGIAVRKKNVGFNIFVQNQGAYTTPPDAVVEADVYIDARFFQRVSSEAISLLPDGTVMLQTGEWSGVYGTHTIRVVLNPENTIEETNTANNRRSVLVKVADI